MARIVNSFVENDPVQVVLNIEKFFEERRPGQESEFLLSKYGFGRKIDLYCGFDVDESGAKEYYVEIWNNFEDDEEFELGGEEPIEIWWLTENTSKEDRLLMLFDALDEMTKQIYKVVEDYEGGYTLK